MRRAFAALLLAAALGGAQPLHAQAADARAQAIAVADSALAAISRGDMVAFTDFMVPEAVLFPTATRDGATRYRAMTREQQRTTAMRVTVTERGWNPTVHVSGGVALVWYPYDLYLDGAWSHCGADVFTMVRHEGRWRILTMAWSAEQPPTCEKHPAGPPR